MKTFLLSLLLSILVIHLSYGQTETFEDESDNTYNFTESMTGATFAVTSNFEIQVGLPFGAGGSNAWLDSQAGNSVTGVIGQIQVSGLTNSFRISQLSVWTSSNDASSQNSGNVTFRGTPVGGGAPLVETIFVDPPSISDYDLITFSGPLAGASITALEVDLTGSGSGLNYIGIDDIVFSQISLPVSLSSFQAKTDNKRHIQLTWETTSELNNSGFEIQKSRNGKDWIAIDFVKGRGTSNELNNYEYIDKKVSNEMNYYRLKQIDFDAKYEYSKTISVQISSGTLEVQLHPNPAHEKFNIIGLQEGKIILLNQVGKIVLKQNFNYPRTEISLLNIPYGIYYVQINSNNQSIIKKLIHH